MTIHKSLVKLVKICIYWCWISLTAQNSYILVKRSMKGAHTDTDVHPVKSVFTPNKAHEWG